MVKKKLVISPTHIHTRLNPSWQP